LFVLWSLSFRDPAPDQDNCAFGAVSNAEYRRLLAQANAQNWTVWPGLSDGVFYPTDRGPLTQPDGQAFEARLAQHFRRSIDRLTFDNESPDAQLAAVHAVMRSIPAEYVSVLETPAYVLLDRYHPTSIEFTYFFPQTRFAPLCAPCIIFKYTTPRVFFHRLDKDVLADLVVLNSDLKYTPNKEEQRNAGPCPAVPPRHMPI